MGRYSRGQKEIAYLEEHPEVTEPNEIDGLQEDIDYWQEQLDDYFKEYKQTDKKTRWNTGRRNTKNSEMESRI